MNYKFLITLLSSSNSDLLKLSYNTIINQYKHNIDYTIILVINSLDTQYYQEVCNEFKDIDVEIIETESNGKPGKGHNSLFEIFHKKKEYDYLISIDGDDFLYPYALYQLDKCFSIDKNVDIVCIYGNDTIRDYNSPYDCSDIYLQNHFYLRMGYNLPKKFSESDLLTNPLRNNIINDGVQTIIRFIMCSRHFINSNKNTLLYCEKCNILDDYRFYLQFIDNVLIKKLNGFIINSDHIYLYNNINHNSISRTQNDKFGDDYRIIKEYINEFKHLEDIIGTDWNLEKIKYYELSPVFDEKLEIVCNENGTYSINKNNLDIKKNYKYLINFASDLSLQYYNVCIKTIENNLFNENGNKDEIFKLCLYLINNKIYDRKLFIYMAICYYYQNDDINTIKYIKKSEYMINKYPVLIDFYENYKNKIDFTS